MFFLLSLILAITFKTQEEKDKEIDRLNKEFEIMKRCVCNYNVGLENLLSEQAMVAERVQKTEREKDEFKELMNQLRRGGKANEYNNKLTEFARSNQLYKINKYEKERFDKRVESAKQNIAEMEKKLEMIKRQRDEAMNASVLK